MCWLRKLARLPLFRLFFYRSKQIREALWEDCQQGWLAHAKASVLAYYMCIQQANERMALRRLLARLISPSICHCLHLFISSSCLYAGEFSKRSLIIFIFWLAYKKVSNIFYLSFFWTYILSLLHLTIEAYKYFIRLYIIGMFESNSFDTSVCWIICKVTEALNFQQLNLWNTYEFLTTLICKDAELLISYQIVP